jgi:hypothetical protein
MLLKRHDSSVRRGKGSVEKASNAARFRSSHQVGAVARLARCEANRSGVKLPKGDFVAT